jgi:hypothetical protein
MTSAGRHEAAAAGQRLAEGPHAQVARPRRQQLGGPGPARAEHPGAVASSTMSRAPWRRQSSTTSGSGAIVALHREDAVDHDEPAPAVAGRALEPAYSSLSSRPWRNGRSFAPALEAADEDRCVVAESRDDGVRPGASSVAQGAEVGLVAGREDERVLRAHPLGELALERQVQRRRPVEQAAARQTGAVLLERRPGTVDHARVGGQPEVVVRAEHDARRALHLHHRARGALDLAEVGEDPRLARGGELLGAVVTAGLGEDVGAGAGHVRCPLAWQRWWSPRQVER